MGIMEPWDAMTGSRIYFGFVSLVTVRICELRGRMDFEIREFSRIIVGVINFRDYGSFG